MQLTIYNTYVLMESQEQCDRMKKLCIDNDLPIWEDESGWDIELGTIFGCCEDGDFFILVNNEDMNHTEVTEQEFINLLKKQFQKLQKNLKTMRVIVKVGKQISQWLIKIANIGINKKQARSN